MRKRLLSTVALLATFAAVLLVAATAQGATVLYSAPPPQGSTSGDCATQADACTLSDAITTASSGDTIELLPGTYNTLSDSGKALSFVGSGAQTQIVGNIASGPVVALATGGSSLENLDIQNNDSTGTALSLSPSTGVVSADRVFATGAGQACSFGGDVTFTNSVCSSSNASSTLPVLSTAGANTLRNDDIWGAGEAYGISGEAASGVAGSDTLINTIVSSGGGEDLYASSDGTANATMTFHVSYSSFLTELAAPAPADPSMEIFNTDPTTDQSASPLLTADFHEKAGSPTVGAGTNDPTNGPLALYGDARQTTTGYAFSYGQTTLLGTSTPAQAITTTDIGADQIQAPPVASVIGAAAIGSDSATLGGKVNPGGAALAHSVIAQVGGLNPGGTYYFELLASNPAGTSTSNQVSFTPGTSNGSSTGGSSGGIYTPGGSTFPGGGSTNYNNGGPTAATASVSATSAKVSGHTSVIVINCAGQAICAGNLQAIVTVFFEAKVNGKKRKEQKTVIVANGLYTVAAASSGKATLRLTANGTKLLASHHGKLAGKLEITPSDGSGTFEQNLTFTAPVQHTAKPKKKSPAKPKKH